MEVNQILVFVLLLFYSRKDAQALLYPRASETREVQSLDGLWNFRVGNTADPDNAARSNWFPQTPDPVEGDDVILMPVPASYNDITVDASLRDHVGLVWYSRTFYVSDLWDIADRRVWLRFGSVSYAARVWVNGLEVANHEIGHLPFQQDISVAVYYGQENTVTVAVSNILLDDTVPQGTLSYEATDNGTTVVQTYEFDFFNYAGIDRPVVLYTTPVSYIDDVTISTTLDGTTGIVAYQISYVQDENIDSLAVSVDVFTREGQVVSRFNGDVGFLVVQNATFWWPYLMDPNPGYLYTLQVTLLLDDEVVDVYRQPFGFRSLSWDETSFSINGQNLYLHGFGRHEDSEIRGKGLDFSLIAKDYNLIKWVGANVYRTSHYPYAEEIMDLADQYGIMIIDECPSVDTIGFTDSLLENHQSSIRQLNARDKNRPSVIAWSLANEPRTESEEAGPYFQSVADFTRSLDTSRPVTIVIDRTVDADYAAASADILSVNRYNGWYTNAGQLDMITERTVDELISWNARHNKPVILMEYGADAVEGLHIYPEFIWSEEYEVALLSKYFEAFDILRTRENSFFIGEFVWNFADFKTAQSITRVGGNRKGIFTRSRQPKAAAFHIRQRYWNLASELYGAPLPDNIQPYVVRKVSKDVKTEL